MDQLGKIFISRLRFLSLKEKKILLENYYNSDELFVLSRYKIEELINRRLRINEQSLKIARIDAIKAKNILAIEEINCLFLGDSNYPKPLAEIYNPPFALYYRGSLYNFNKPTVAIVGTRVASGKAIDSAFELGLRFAESGFPVVSGLALGADSAGHSGALAANGVTLAVLGCGVDSIYPAVNKKLASKIVEKDGAVLSEYLPGESARRYNFVERNRIISGLSRGVIVIQAPGKSGALITADFALEQGRDLYIHEAAMADCKEGSRLHRLVSEGAPVIEDISDVLIDWGFPIRKNKKENTLGKAFSNEVGQFMAERMKSEIEGNYIKFNGKFYRRGRNEDPHSFNSRVTG